MALGPGWVLEAYMGWRVALAATGLKVLRRGWGPFARTLALGLGVQDEALDRAVRPFVGRFAGATTLVDFADNSEEAARRVAGVSLTRVFGPRWFGVGTFVIDLARPEEDLMARMAARERQACRRARQPRVEIVPQPGQSDLADFGRLYEPMALSRELEPVRQPVLARMAAAGDLWLVRVRDTNGVVVVANLLFARPPSACYLFGARKPNSPGWAGAAAQWHALLALKEAGFRWYDLGLVASCSPDDGIFRFKSGLGGEFIPSGSEYERKPALFSVARRLARRAGLRGWQR